MEQFSTVYLTCKDFQVKLDMSLSTSLPTPSTLNTLYRLLSLKCSVSMPFSLCISVNFLTLK